MDGIFFKPGGVVVNRAHVPAEVVVVGFDIRDAVKAALARGPADMGDGGQAQVLFADSRPKRPFVDLS